MKTSRGCRVRRALLENSLALYHMATRRVKKNVCRSCFFLNVQRSTTPTVSKPTVQKFKYFTVRFNCENIEKTWGTRLFSRFFFPSICFSDHSHRKHTQTEKTDRRPTCSHAHHRPLIILYSREKSTQTGASLVRISQLLVIHESCL